ncbi:MAG: hypothetical protein AAF664_02335 [Planctomycetota bacterium]
MNQDDSIPRSYAEWRQFIEANCGIRLTRDFLASRLAELQNKKNSRTKEFAKIYGPAQLENTIAWFGQALKDLPSGSGERHRA